VEKGIVDVERPAVNSKKLDMRRVFVTRSGILEVIRSQEEEQDVSSL
jgi:hypothetical protein